MFWQCVKSQTENFPDSLEEIIKQLVPHAETERERKSFLICVLCDILDFTFAQKEHFELEEDLVMLHYSLMKNFQSFYRRDIPLHSDWCFIVMKNVLMEVSSIPYAH